MAKNNGQFTDEWGRSTARKRYADGGGVTDSEIQEADRQNSERTARQDAEIKQAAQPPSEGTFGAASSFLSRNAPSGVRKLFGGK